MDALQPDDPQRVGRYRLLKRLGAGGMGRVYLGQSPSGRLVAVKLIRPELADNPDFRHRFAQEVTAARQVSGIFTAPVVDADPDGPQPWLVTAFVSGPSLTDAVASQGPLPVESVLTLAAGLAEGLGAVHEAGVVHRDLKPSNVLLASDGPRIIDFGISRAADSTWLTHAGGVVGSPGFMSPEQAEGREVGPPTDIFSLGGVLMFAATGEPPFGAGSASALLYRVVYGTAATGNVPAEIRPLVERCLAKDPVARPTTDELLAELGYAEPGEDWLTWDRPAAVMAAPVPARHREVAPATTREPAQVTHREPLPPATSEPPLTRHENAPVDGHKSARETAPEPTAYRDYPTAVEIAGPEWRAEPGDVPGHRAHRSAQRRSGMIGLAVAAALAGAAAAIVALVVLHHQPRDPGKPGAGATGAGSSVQAARATEARAVVESYYRAINGHNWPKVWRLGGQNLNESYDSMVAGYSDTARDVIRSIRVVGDRVIVRLRAYETSGLLQVYEDEYLVRDGVIVSGSEQLLGTG
jgi:serine/threonine protein kinase